MHHLPPPGSPLLEMFDISDLVAIGTGAERPATLPEALRSAKKSFAADTAGLTRRIVYICLMADDALWLVSVGPKGGWRKEWEFQPGAYSQKRAV